MQEELILPTEQQKRTRKMCWPVLRKNNTLTTLEKIDVFLQQIGNDKLSSMNPLNRYILYRFYVHGRTIQQIHDEVTAGVEGVPSVTKERIRSIVFILRGEILGETRQVYTQGLNIKDTFIQEINEYSKASIGEIIYDKKMVKNPRIHAIACLLHKRVVVGDSTIFWLKDPIFFINETIEKREFNIHYLSLFYYLQKEVLPTPFDTIITNLPNQLQWKKGEVSTALIRLILQHHEVFGDLGNDNWWLNYPYLNITQQFARIVYEKKQATTAEIINVAKERGSYSKSGNISLSGQKYPWCLPVGKTMWIYKEDGQSIRKPIEIVKDFCEEKVEFHFDEAIKCLQAEGINMKPISARCYVLKFCRRHRDIKDLFRLNTAIPEGHESEWYQRSTEHTHTKKKKWVGKLERRIRRILTKNGERMAQKDVLKLSMDILENEGIAKNNFYKVIPSYTWIEITREENVIYLVMKK